MAFTHIVMFKWQGGKADFDAAGLADALRNLVARFDGVQSYRCGPDVGLSPNAHDFGIVGTFDSREDFMTYRDHPDHKKIIEEMILPSVESRVVVQLED